MSIVQEANLAVLEERALASFAEFARLARRTVEQGWHCGEALQAVKDALPHGGWLPWLEDNGIARRTASHLLKLHSAYPEMGKLCPFESVDAALKAAAQPKAIAPPKPEPDEPGSALAAPEGDLGEPQDDAAVFASLEAALYDEREKNEELEERISIILEGNERELVAKYSSNRELIRTLKARVNQLLHENGFLTRERRMLKRKLAAAEKELEALKPAEVY